jgi:hypothetical protein
MLTVRSRQSRYWTGDSVRAYPALTSSDVQIIETSFVLAATEHLHRQIANMSGRIRQLEDALGLLQSRHSTELHPLLRDDLRGTDQKDEFSHITLPGDNAAGPSNPPEILDAFGTLSITDHGISRFFGPTGGSEVSALSLSNVMYSFFIS